MHKDRPCKGVCDSSGKNRGDGPVYSCRNYCFDSETQVIYSKEIFNRLFRSNRILQNLIGLVNTVIAIVIFALVEGLTEPIPKWIVCYIVGTLKLLTEMDRKEIYHTCLNHPLRKLI